MRFATHARSQTAELLRGCAGLAMSAATFGVSLAGILDVQSVTGDSLTNGAVDITVSPAADIVSNPAALPGQVQIGEVTVTNSGALELRYSITGDATDPDGTSLHAQLDVDIWPEVNEVDVSGTDTDCESSEKPGDAPRLLVDDGRVGREGSAAEILGDATPGYQSLPGGGDRTLVAGASETLCFEAALPSDTGNAHQDSATTITYGFLAEHTGNNP